MATMSNIAIAIKAEKIESFKSFMCGKMDDPDDIQKHETGELWYFEDIRWSMIDKFVTEFYRILKEEIGEDNCLVMEQCITYPGAEEGNFGKWNDNPFCLSGGGITYNTFN